MNPSTESDATHEDIASFAKGVTIDQRIPEACAGFDVPFHQAGLAGYSDGAMRLIARKHGCPFSRLVAFCSHCDVLGFVNFSRNSPLLSLLIPTLVNIKWNTKR